MRHVKPISNWNDPASSGMLRLTCQATIKQEDYYAWDILQLLCAYLPLGATKYLKNCSPRKEITATVTLLRIILQSYIKRAPFPLFSNHYMIGMWQERSKA